MLNCCLELAGSLREGRYGRFIPPFCCKHLSMLVNWGISFYRDILKTFKRQGRFGGIQSLVLNSWPQLQAKTVNSLSVGILKHKGTLNKLLFWCSAHYRRPILIPPSQCKRLSQLDLLFPSNIGFRRNVEVTGQSCLSTRRPEWGYLRACPHLREVDRSNCLNREGLIFPMRISLNVNDV